MACLIQKPTNGEETGGILARRMVASSNTPDKYVQARDVPLQKLELDEPECEISEMDNRPNLIHESKIQTGDSNTQDVTNHIYEPNLLDNMLYNKLSTHWFVVRWVAFLDVSLDGIPPMIKCLHYSKN